MRDDLLGAQASIDWAVSNFPSLNKRLRKWLDDNVSHEIKELESSETDDLIVAVEKDFLPLSYNVEVGAYINAIRSSLDILACALATRHRIGDLDNIYFPIVKSAALFTSGHYKGSKLVKGLPPAERAIVESLKPYDGGNKLLWSLHQLDIVRKHQRLLDVDISPQSFQIISWGNIDEYVTMVRTGWMRATYQETILAFLKKGVPKPDVRLTPHVTFNEPILGRKPIIAALNEFASLAASIIKLFDAA